MKTIMFNSIQVINYWFTLHCALRLLYQQAQTFSSYIQGILDQDITTTHIIMTFLNSIFNFSHLADTSNYAS